MRILNFNDGFSSNSEPNMGTISANNLFKFADDSEFVAYKDAPASNGDLYFNTTLEVIRFYSGSAWENVASESQLLALTESMESADESLQEEINTVQGNLDSYILSNNEALSNHINDNDSAHAASAISVIPTGNLSSTDGQSAFNELQSDIDTRATSAALSSHAGASTGVHGVIGNVVGTTDTQILTNKDIDGGTASVNSRFTLPKGPKATLDTLPRKQGSIFYDTISNTPFFDNGTALQAFGGGGSSDSSLFSKSDSHTPVFTKTGASSLSIKAGTTIVVQGTVLNILANTAVVMPALSTGTDYAVFGCTDGTVRADANFTAPTGYTPSNSRIIGGFHYGAVSPTETVAGGSFATTGNGMIWTQGDVDKLKGINQFSIWDLKFRPACSDPRGMTLVANRFWVDIYFCNTNPEVNGTSKYNSDVASGAVLPKKPTMFGGNGTATYANLNGWTANELARAFGKRFMKESEFVVAAFGVTEDKSLGGAASTITNAVRQAGYTSKWGLEQATGHHYTWGEDTSIRPTYATDAWGWQDVNGDRGQRYLINSLGESRILLGGHRVHAAYSGSRAANWGDYPWNSYWGIGLRAACDHLQLV